MYKIPLDFEKMEVNEIGFIVKLCRSCINKYGIPKEMCQDTNFNYFSECSICGCQNKPISILVIPIYK